MRDKRLIAEHRGGSLRKDQHRQLIMWACICAENVLPLLGEIIDERLINALTVANPSTCVNLRTILTFNDNKLLN